MRIYIRTTPNSQPVPFNYQRALVGAFHKWLGPNNMHDGLSLYSLGWLQGGKAVKNALDFQSGAFWQISSPDNELLKTLIEGIHGKPEIAFGMKVGEVILQPEPKFPDKVRLFVQSPVLIKRSLDKRIHYYLYNDKVADDLLTETLKNKLKKFGKGSENISVSFDRTYPRSRTKMIDYNGIKIKASLCPVILKGTPEAIAFAWNVGVGNSTGIGFGCLR